MSKKLNSIAEPKTSNGHGACTKDANVLRSKSSRLNLRSESPKWGMFLATVQIFETLVPELVVVKCENPYATKITLY
jgi:hypothetical protein